MSEEIQRIYEFGAFRLDVAERVLWRDGEKVALTQKALELLLLLIERSGKVVTKEELINALWPETFVDENNLSVTIFMLRKAFGEKSGERLFIETVPRRGYRFIAPVREVEREATDLVIERHARTVITVEQEEASDEADEVALESAASVEAQRRLIASSEADQKWRRPNVLIAAAFVVVLALTGALVYTIWNASRARSRQNSEAAANAQAPKAAMQTIAVLPLKSLGAIRPGEEYLSIGMTDALITKLSSIRQIAVRSTSAILRYADAPTEPRVAGRELGVDVVLEGTLQREGERLRVTMQLVRVSDGATVWAARFDEKLTGLFELQDSISNQIASAVLPQISGEQRELLARRDTDDREAYKLYLKGRYHWNKRTTDGFQQSIKLFNEAISRDPLYALAHAGLADSYVLLSEYNVAPPADTFPKAKAAANRALEIEPDLAEARTTLAYVLASYDWNFAEAEREYRRALELNPNYATAHQWYGELLFGLKRFDEAEREINRAIDLDPLSPMIQTDLGLLLFYKRDFEAAIAHGKKTVQNFPDFPTAHAQLSLVYERAGNLDQAAEETIEFLRLSGADEKAVALMRDVYRQQGYKGFLQALLAGTNAEAQKRYVPAFAQAFLYARLGDRDNALIWLEKAYNERFRYVAYIGSDPDFDFLRDDPQFQDLLKRIGLP